jgi:hypothetical protein
MHLSIEAWRAKHSLFESAREVIRWERRGARRAEYVARNPEVISRRKGGEPDGDYIGIAAVADMIDKNFEGVEAHMARLERVPPELRLVEPCDSPLELAAILGELVVPKSLKVGRLVHGQNGNLLAA